MKKMVLASAALMSAAATQAQQAAGPVDTLTAQAMQEVVVQGVRAPKNAPFAVSNIKKQDLETFSKTGQELPFLFANTPGVLAWSENGTGMGTSYMRIRGAAGSRINVTLDGVSLNSPEDQTVFWANMNSYAALMGSVQIQRGIGTSTHGDGAFGGSVALATATPSLKPSLELTGSYGSFNTYHAGAKFSTGLLFNHLIFDGAYNETATDGFVHGTATRFFLEHYRSPGTKHPRICYIGCTGKREDHTLGNISLPTFYRQEFGVEGVLPTDFGWFVYCHGACEFESIPNQQVSIFNLDCSSLTSQGLQWPIYPFAQWWQGTVNNALGHAFSIDGNGDYIVYRTYEAKRQPHAKED